MNKILIIILMLIISFSAFPQSEEYYKQTKTEKYKQLESVSGTVWLMANYMEAVKTRRVHIGWELILNESDSYYTSKSVYYPEFTEYLQPYQYNHDYDGLLYGVDNEKHIREYDYMIQGEYLRAEKIMVPEKPNFENFYKWMLEYFEFKE